MQAQRSLRARVSFVPVAGVASVRRLARRVFGGAPGSMRLGARTPQGGPFHAEMSVADRVSPAYVHGHA
eukprot:9592929-Lingulodinium_polyedra.AAC.1